MPSRQELVDQVQIWGETKTRLTRLIAMEKIELVSSER